MFEKALRVREIHEATMDRSDFCLNVGPERVKVRSYKNLLLINYNVTVNSCVNELDSTGMSLRESLVLRGRARGGST